MLKSYLLILSFLAFTLTACSPQDMFSNLATTKEERAAGQNIDQNEAIRAKLDRIQQKKDSFAQFVDLGVVQADVEAAAIAFRNDYQQDGDTKISIEATLPDLDQGYYEAWLIGDTPDDAVMLNALSYNGPDDYVLDFTSDQDLSAYQTITITTEIQADDIPEERLLIGSFSTNI